MHKTAHNIFDRSVDGDYVLKSDTQIRQIYTRKSNEYTENRIYPYLKASDFVDGIVDRVRRMIKINRVNHPWNNLADDDFFKTAGLYRYDFITGKEGFTLSAALLFGKPEVIKSIIPHYKIDALVRIENTDRYDDRENIRENLIDSYDKLMAFVGKHLPDKFFLEGTTRISLRDKIFREIIANILIHREYTNAFPSTFIIYKNKVITQNANKPNFYGKLEPNNYKAFPKNPDIANLFTQLGYSEELGTGIKNVYKYIKAYTGSDNVIFKEDDVFITTIPLKDTVVDVVTDNDTDNDTDNRKEKILRIITKNNKISTKQMSILCNVSQITIKRDIEKLKKQNRIKRIGNKKSGYWKIIQNKIKND